MSSAGFTFIELSMVLAMSAVLALLALPSFQSLAAKRKVQQAAQALVMDMRFARTEAIKRSRRVEICSTAGGQTCSTPPAAGWAGGWLVLAGSEVLRARGPHDGLLSSSSLLKVAYEPTGLAQGSAGNMSFTASSNDALVQRVCVSLQGRVRLPPFGESTC